MQQPEWWSWEIELSPHVLKRMVDRGFNEIALRQMLEDAADIAPDPHSGRWIIRSVWERRRWVVIVEPSAVDRVVVVITAYHLE